MAAAFGISVLAVFSLSFSSIYLSEAKSFTIDYKNNVFLKDGEPFRYISGSIHYFRVPRFYWKERLLKMKFAGLNAIQTYVAWNVHEQQNGTYNFEGENDLEEFIRLAHSLGLLVVLRPGPYICGEWELGGFPAWLIKNSSIILRSSKDRAYISAVDRWMGVLLPKIKPLLYNNGGPVITVQTLSVPRREQFQRERSSRETLSFEDQIMSKDKCQGIFRCHNVENEYGSYYTCDHAYMSHLESLFRKHLGNDVVLFTTDGFSDSMLKCGSLPSMFTTVDFGPGIDPTHPFAILRKYQPTGPLVNSEFYPGWLDHWGERHQTVNPAQVAKYLDLILAMNASVNLYMFEGGTSFGFMNGANCGTSISQFQPQPTSYDYDAPLTEAGDTTQKYFLILEVISRYMGVPSGVLPPSTPKYAYGKVLLKKIGRLLDVLPILSPNGYINATYPLTMEQIGQNYGFALYQTQIPSKYANHMVTLSIPGVRDRAVIYVGKIRQATICRVDKPTASIVVGEFLTLSLLVENMGRINYGPHLVDPKGILGNVTLGDDVLVNWKMYPLNINNILGYTRQHLKGYHFSEVQTSNAPTFFTADIPPSEDGIPKDTFLYLEAWKKGQVYINGFNVGRYWPAVGPQDTLFVPASILTPGQQPSKLVLLELDENPCDYPEGCFVTFRSTPIINGAVKPLNVKAVQRRSKQWISKYVGIPPQSARAKEYLIEALESLHRSVD